MNLLIAGAGGHGRVVGDIAATSGAFRAIAFIDDKSPQLSLTEDWRVIGKLDMLPSFVNDFEVIGLGFGKAKLRLATVETALKLGFRCPPIVHPAATVSRFASIGAGSVICAGAIVSVGVSIGVGCIINTGATIDHDCRISDGVHVCPGAHLAGNVELGAHSWFGIGAVAREGVRVGADTTVGAGAVVIADLPSNAVFVGNPARQLL